MSPADHGERAPWGLPRPVAWLRWVGWAVRNRAFTRHHLLSYLRMARASARYPSLRFEGPCFIGPDVRFEVREGYARLVVGAYTHFGAHARVRAHEGTLRIGSKSVIGIRTTINCWLDIAIGDTCLFGDDVYICDFDHVTDLDAGAGQGPGHRQVAGADRRRRLARHQGGRHARHRPRRPLRRRRGRRGARGLPAQVGRGRHTRQGRQDPTAEPRIQRREGAVARRQTRGLGHRIVASSVLDELGERVELVAVQHSPSLARSRPTGRVSRGRPSRSTTRGTARSAAGRGRGGAHRAGPRRARAPSGPASAAASTRSRGRSGARADRPTPRSPCPHPTSPVRGRARRPRARPRAPSAPWSR